MPNSNKVQIQSIGMPLQKLDGRNDRIFCRQSQWVLVPGNQVFNPSGIRGSQNRIVIFIPHGIGCRWRHHVAQDAHHLDVILLLLCASVQPCVHARKYTGDFAEQKFADHGFERTALPQLHYPARRALVAAARLAQCTLPEMVRYLALRGIAAVNLSAEEAQADLSALDT